MDVVGRHQAERAVPVLGVDQGKIDGGMLTQDAVHTLILVTERALPDATWTIHWPRLLTMLQLANVSRAAADSVLSGLSESNPERDKAM
jgi:hypothetical protein